jgi:WD40 repeat protein
MQTLDAYKGKVRCLSFSADGTLLASGGGVGRSISLWPLPGGKRTRLPSRRGGPRTLAFAPTGTALAAPFWYDVGIWLDPARMRNASWYRARAFAFREDGAVLALLENAPGPPKATIRFVDTLRGEPTGTPLTIQDVGLELTCSPTGANLAAIVGISIIGHFKVALLRPEMAQDSIVIFSLPGVPNGLTFSPDGRTLVVACRQTILRWDVETATRLPNLRGHTRVVHNIAYLPDGRLLSCSKDGTVRTWLDGKCVDVKDWQLGELTALAAARDGMRAAVGSKSGTILIWDID